MLADNFFLAGLVVLTAAAAAVHDSRSGLHPEPAAGVRRRDWHSSGGLFAGAWSGGFLGAGAGALSAVLGAVGTAGRPRLAVSRREASAAET